MIWMELRCDGRIPGCFSNANNDEYGPFMTNQRAVLAGLKYLQEQARKKGWTVRGSNIYCPNCTDKRSWNIARPPYNRG